jgi:hypothetical protein
MAHAVDTSAPARSSRPRGRTGGPVRRRGWDARGTCATGGGTWRRAPIGRHAGRGRRTGWSGARTARAPGSPEHAAGRASSERHSHERRPPRHHRERERHEWRSPALAGRPAARPRHSSRPGSRSSGPVARSCDPGRSRVGAGVWWGGLQRVPSAAAVVARPPSAARAPCRRATPLPPCHVVAPRPVAPRRPFSRRARSGRRVGGGRSRGAGAARVVAERGRACSTTWSRPGSRWPWGSPPAVRCWWGSARTSVIEVTATLAARWRLGADHDAVRRARAEWWSHRVIGTCFVLLAAYVAWESATALLHGEAPRRARGAWPCWPPRPS